MNVELVNQALENSLLSNFPTDLPLDVLWNMFLSEYNSIVSAHIPIRPTYTGHIPFYLKNSEFRVMLTIKYKKWRSYCNFPSLNSLSEYRIARRNVSKLSVKLRRNYETHLILDTSNPLTISKFFNYAKQHMRIPSQNISLIKPDGHLSTTDAEAACIFNEQFTSVFNTPVVRGTYKSHLPTLNKMSDSGISEEMIQHKLHELNPGKSPGPDGIHPRMLKQFSTYFARPLWIIFRKSLVTGSVPEDWKNAIVVPIYKKKSRCLAKNYRPVSLTSVICKLLESLIKPHLLDFVLTNMYIQPDQHGFIPHRSCVTNLLETLDDWTYSIDNGIPVDVIFIDFEKAFDKVQHGILLDKLEAIGINIGLVKWISSFLIGRKQRVMVGNSLYNWSIVRSGVPQGSVLGPILFLIYTFDIPSKSLFSCQQLHNSTLLSTFADDTKLYCHSYRTEDCSNLQADLDALNNWSKLNYMSINIDKCCVLNLHKKNTHYPYILEGNIIRSVEVVTDVGIKLHSSLTFSKHIVEIANEANRVFGFIKMTFSQISPMLFKKIYKTLILTKLEYGCQAWCPYLQKDIRRLERVQRRATKWVQGLANFPYRERLLFLGLTCRTKALESGYGTSLEIY